MAGHSPIENLAQQATAETTNDPATTQLHDSADRSLLLLEASRHGREGGVKEALPYFEKLVQAAEKDIPASTIATQLDRVEQSLETGKLPGSGSDLTDAERLVMHQIAVNLSAISLDRATAHEQYALYLKSVGRTADAESELIQTETAADAMPIGLIKREIACLNKDAKNPNLTAAVREEMTQALQQLSFLTQAPITVREEMARFYLAHGHNPDGSTIGDTTVAGYDEKGPIMTNSDTGESVAAIAFLKTLGMCANMKAIER